MKNLRFRFWAILIAIFVFSVVVFSSCDKPVTTTVTTVKTKVTLTEPGTNGFLISQEIVVKGNTVWGFSEKAYGKGEQWRDIVLQNPFLQEPGRVYYNKSKKMWIVKIYPGEVIKIGGEIITPSCVVEEITTTTEKTSSPEPIIPWWLVWTLVSLIVLALIVRLFVYNRSNNSSATATIHHVDMSKGEDVDSATQITLKRIISEERIALFNSVMTVADKTNISSLDVHLGSDRFDVKTSYFEQKCEAKAQKEQKVETKEAKK